MLRGWHITVVDDDADVRTSTALVLTALEARVQTFNSADDLLRVGVPDSTNIILLDSVLPGTRGSNALSAIRERFPSVPVLLVSGSLDAIEEASDVGANLLRKPYSVESLTAQILRVANASVSADEAD